MSCKRGLTCLVVYYAPAGARGELKMITVKKQTIEELLKAWRTFRLGRGELLDNLKAKFKVRRQLKKKDRQNFDRVWYLCYELQNQTKIHVDFYSLIELADTNGKADMVIYQMLDLIDVQVTGN